MNGVYHDDDGRHLDGQPGSARTAGDPWNDRVRQFDRWTNIRLGRRFQKSFVATGLQHRLAHCPVRSRGGSSLPRPYRDLRGHFFRRQPSCSTPETRSIDSVEVRRNGLVDEKEPLTDPESVYAGERKGVASRARLCNGRAPVWEGRAEGGRVFPTFSALAQAHC